MIPTERPLDNPINWSFRVGRVRSIDIRVHVAFVLAAVVVVWMQLPPRGSEIPWQLSTVLIDGLGLYAILFGIVLLHEFGHCWGARRTGGQADEILLWPLGGLAYVQPPHDPRAHMVTALAGPMVNVAICAICSGAIAAWAGSLGAVPWNPLHPLQPADAMFLPTTGQTWLIRIFGISYFLLLINMLPIFPFDGGRVLQAWLWPRRGYRESIEIATGTGMVGAIGIALFGLFVAEGWLLIMIAVFGYITCWQTRRMVKYREDAELGEFGYGSGGTSESFDYAPRPPRRVGYFAARRARKAALREDRERKDRHVRQQLVEEILGKISRSGMDSLTPQERRILQEETERRRTAHADFVDNE